METQGSSKRYVNGGEVTAYLFDVWELNTIANALKKSLSKIEAKIKRFEKSPYHGSIHYYSKMNKLDMEKDSIEKMIKEFSEEAMFKIGKKYI